MQPAFWRVSELAKRTGLTVRTPRRHDEIGLLSPSQRSEAGYRLYTLRDVARLQQIRSLRELGFSPEEADDCLDRRVIELHLARPRLENGPAAEAVPAPGPAGALSGFGAGALGRSVCEDC